MFQRGVSAHATALNNLLDTSDTESIAHAIQMLRSVPCLYSRSAPVPADRGLSAALMRSERPCSLLDFAGGMAGPQIATIGAEDLQCALNQMRIQKHR